MTAQWDSRAEEWRSIAGYEGLYEVSSLGRVRSLYFTPPRVLSLTVSDKDGYTMVSLYKEGKRRNLVLHRVVCETFNGPANILHTEVAHLDGTRTNAAAANLKWVSRPENRHHMRAHRTAVAGERHPRAKLTDAQAVQVSAMLSRGGRTYLVARHFGVSFHVIDGIKRGRNWRHVLRSTASPVLSEAKDAPVSRPSSYGEVGV